MTTRRSGTVGAMRVIPDRSVVTSLADPTRFTGRVWRTDYIDPDDLEHLAGSRFHYEPGARSYWHVHEHEQAIVGIFGSGIVAWEGLDRPVELGPGDWWHVEPGVPHWHGADAHHGIRPPRDHGGRRHDLAARGRGRRLPPVTTEYDDLTVLAAFLARRDEPGDARPPGRRAGALRQRGAPVTARSRRGR